MPKLADLPPVYDERTLASAPLKWGEGLEGRVCRKQKRARHNGRTSAWVAGVYVTWQPEPGRVAISKFGRVTPTLDCAALPLLLKVVRDLTAAAYAEGLVTRADFTRAGIETPDA